MNVKVDVLDPTQAPMGGPKKGKYVVYHGTNDSGAQSLSTHGIDRSTLNNPDEFQVSIDPQQAAHFGADEVAQNGGVLKLVRYKLPEDKFLELYHQGHVTQSAASGSLSFDSFAQDVLNSAFGA